VSGNKVKWFENNLHHIHRSIDVAATCKGTSHSFLFTDVSLVLQQQQQQQQQQQLEVRCKAIACSPTGLAMRAL